MKIIANSDHRTHHARHEFFRGRKVDAFEKPERLDGVMSALSAAGWAEFVTPERFADATISAVHDTRYLRFLEGAHAEHLALGGAGDAFPAAWPIRGMRADVEPLNFAARLGLYSFDSGTPLTAGSWTAARAGADCALTGARLVAQGEHSAFVLTRPPGHHAGRDFFGGYCFLNNAAIAAQWLLTHGQRRVAILDVDYHHGNGTQAIFYDRADVLFVSIHADPRTDYPFYLGHADEAGEGTGRGFNLNLPLAQGASPETWFEALAVALDRVRAHAPDTLIVSLGVDTYEADPICAFRLRTGTDYPRLGREVAMLDLPTLWVMEGGYAVEAIGANVTATLGGFLGRGQRTD